NHIQDDLVKTLSDELLGQKLSFAITRLVAGEPEEIIAADRKITKMMLGRLAACCDTYQMKDCDEKEAIEEILRNYRNKLRNKQ
ncbi:MAG: hypothetical protein J6U21_14930, partial [Bacteroidales bacterium]|nr:hypothetical protein [Bacteroidales bacterium]